MSIDSAGCEQTGRGNSFHRFSGAEPPQSLSRCIAEAGAATKRNRPVEGIVGEHLPWIGLEVARHFAKQSGTKLANFFIDHATDAGQVGCAERIFPGYSAQSHV